MKQVYETYSAEETYRLGQKFGERAQPGQIYTLTGDLGTGKTVFTQGFAAGMGIRESVNSPTFTILQEYEEGRLPFYHFDVYRIGDAQEMEEIGYELIEELLPDYCVRIFIEKDLEKGFDYRKIEERKQSDNEDSCA